MRRRRRTALPSIAVALTTAALALTPLTPLAPTAEAAEAAEAPPRQLLIAPLSTCPHQSELGASNALQQQAMRCLVNFARRGRGLSALAASAVLDRAAEHKSADILACDQFSHEACGRPFTYWMEQFGYLRDCTGVGENIAWGTGALGSVRSIFRAWMHSPGHRENILGPFDDIGIGLRVGALEGSSGAHVWTQDFGSSC